jgi:hypothetical protein
VLQGLHWIYDPEKIKKLMSDAGRDTPEFFEPPSCPFYTYESGRLSPYGDEIVPLLRSVRKGLEVHGILHRSGW